MSDTPLVSCIMPTRNRRRFVAQAIWYFVRQDYSHRELIVVDDGEDQVEDLVPQDDRIRYVHLPQHMTLGAKRNLACEMARGDLIAHWDDDDWIAPHRLSLQVAQLLDGEADVCGAHDLLHYWLDAGEAWLYRYPVQERAWLLGCTLLYRRATWAAHRFPEINVGEDNAFVWSLPSERLRAVDDLSFYVALIHPANTGAKNLNDPSWQRRPLDDVRRLISYDTEFYVGLRNGASMRATPTRCALASITLGAQFEIASGYGSMSEYLALGLARAGATVNLVPLSLDLGGMSDEFVQLLRRSQPEHGAPALYFSWPRPELDHFRHSPELFINTMWESGELPKGWAQRLNRARAVIVPTRFVASVCRASGVTVPIEVIPEGIDPAVYHLVERPEREGIAALTIGPIDDRKHVPEAIAAWMQAFAGDPHARLIIKTQYNYQNYTPNDPRITYIDRREHTRGLMHYYALADVLLALGNEGFGLPMVEAMATGLPVIALSSEGQGDVCEDARDLVLPIEPSAWEPYDNQVFGRCGVRGVPSVAEVADRLRWVAAHRDEARALGRAAAQWATQHRNVWSKAPAVLDVMERYVQPARPLHRSRVMWTPSWSGACGVAEYSAHLSDHLPALRVAASAPDLRATRLLHVQYGDGLFNDIQLASVVSQAHQAHVPVVVTEHSVWQSVQAWERDADVLAAMTTRGVDMLRRRWPNKRVEHIPHGCPTWFPPRKTQRGRVIGVFGFLETYKGFRQLPDVLRALPGTELLMFSHAKSREAEREWECATEGLPVCRLSEFLPIAHVARRLAAEADVLVFWYDEVSYAAASGAVRVALATGVPVLASPTSWFDELREVTYQPRTLVEGVQQLLGDGTLGAVFSEAAREYCHAHSWAKIAERHLALWESVERV